MPVYLVRWPHLTATLVRAEDEDELFEILDSAGNCDGCEWTVYEAPLAIDFALPVEWSIRGEAEGLPVSPDQVVVENLGPLAEKYAVAAMEVSLSSCEAGSDMGTLVLETAFLVHPLGHAAVVQD